MIRRGSLLLTAILSIAAPGLAQSVHQEVAVQVTAMSGNNVFIDKGRAAGIEPGDDVTLFPRGQATVVVRVISVSRSNARTELIGKPVAIAPGTRGTVKIPRARLQKAKPKPAPGKGQAEVPDHPPWEQPLQKQDGEQPLLAPVAGRTPAERPTRLHGRVWLNTTTSFNRGQVDQEFLLSSLGTDLTISNPLGYGGEFLLRGDASHRRAQFDFAEDEVTTRGRLDRLSYRYGHASNAPRRFQIGRFLQTAFPELGLVDGIEADTRLGTNNRVGFSAGGFPEPFVTQATGDDVQTAVFWRYASGEAKEFDVGLAYQKTWHKGSSDRDLLLINLYARPTDDLTLYGSAWIDYYTSNEQVESSGFELTELLLNGSYRMSKGSGLGLSVSNIRWPDLRRNEFTPLTAAQLTDDRVFRATGNSWHDLSTRVRASTLITWWEDQARDGLSGEVGLAFRDMLYDHGSVEVRVFRTEGALQEGTGARLLASYYAGTTSWHGGYEISRYEDDNPALAESYDTLHALTGGLQMMLTNSTDFSCNVDYRFGDAQDALTIGAFIQTRF